ncbi:hypothetical protein RFI_03078 [Reticulomyxa filosa]|uniref:Uncharacterized protein n=1 Tax=Reticulomyxa filosa TaxID=46433 RepID=X6P736_RETFI|nr:hypothetical protein RFI_03078 [Reticulomyxa filosa]|eukprot:ETO34016.1 hypothetical protein RFI_03078 [Reticulomyxa filosa]
MLDKQKIKLWTNSAQQYDKYDFIQKLHEPYFNNRTKSRKTEIYLIVKNEEIFPLLFLPKGTNSDVKLFYYASEDLFDTEMFHDNCNRAGKTLTIVQSIYGFSICVLLRYLNAGTPDKFYIKKMKKIQYGPRKKIDYVLVKKQKNIEALLKCPFKKNYLIIFLYNKNVKQTSQNDVFYRNKEDKNDAELKKIKNFCEKEINISDFINYKSDIRDLFAVNIRTFLQIFTFFYIYHRYEKIWILPCGHYLCDVIRIFIECTIYMINGHNKSNYYITIIESICTEKIYENEKDYICHEYIFYQCSNIECSEIIQYFSEVNVKISEINKYPKHTILSVLKMLNYFCNQ